MATTFEGPREAHVASGRHTARAQSTSDCSGGQSCDMREQQQGVLSGQEFYTEGGGLRTRDPVSCDALSECQE